MYTLPLFVWLLEGVAMLGTQVMLGIALFRGARAAGLAVSKAVLVGAGSFGALIAWAVIAGLLADHGAFRLTAGTRIPLAGLVSAAALVALLLATRIPLVRRSLADERAPARLALVHTFRVVGIVFVLLMLLGDLPAVFALPAGLGDMAVGVTAPLVAARIARHGPYGLRIWLFNLLGIIDLVVAVTIALLAAVFAVSPSVAPLALLPLAVIPTARVPLAIAVHVVSLLRARRPRAGWTATSRELRAPAA